MRRSIFDDNNRVVHVDDATHAAARAFCKAHGLRMTQWVSGLIESVARQRKPTSAYEALLAEYPCSALGCPSEPREGLSLAQLPDELLNAF
jgi:hypothetical protein